MKLVIRYFFRGIRAVLAPVLLGLEAIARPKGVARPPHEQQRIDEEASELVIYQFRACPFCIKVRRALKKLSIEIELRDALKNDSYRRELLEGGGQIKVPCLRIPTDGGGYQWLYESNDIIQYLNNRFATAPAD